MMNQKEYRHEFKYPISDTEAVILKQRLSTVMTLDPHVTELGKYIISSLYFDTIDNKCFYENENGTDPREKFRIRLYNHNPERISLECKRKERGKTLKTASAITASQVQESLTNKLITVSSGDNALLFKFYHQQVSEGLIPKVIVEYERVPYIYAAGNVRVTFDSNLSSSNMLKNFLSGQYIRRPVMPCGMQLLEVKYDSFLPDVIYKALQMGELTQTAFSKYYLCRKYSIKL